jgi:hypothetical protein
MVSFYYKGSIQINQIKISIELPVYPLSLEPMKKLAQILYLFNLLILCQLHNPLFAQMMVGPESKTLVYPVGIPIFLAGNFGEPRANHYHSGIDIKTNGATGVAVRSVSSGYVSRIKVEPGGYGKALYIRHPDGYTSLYGHLQSFQEEISDYVKSEQYRRESFSVDLFPEPTRFVITQGQLIALSGNSGSSDGPHLHFELRETASENPINPLVRSFHVKDVTPPIVEKIHIYSLKDSRDWVKPIAVSVKKIGSVYSPVADTPVPFDALSGIGLETFDLIDGSANRCGVYKILGFLDEELFFESCMDEFSFAETRYMNSLMDYKKYQNERKYVLRLFIEPNNQATIYKFAKNRGRIELKNNNIHKFRIVIQDVAGNQSEVKFDAKLDLSKFSHDKDVLPLYSAYFNYEEPNYFAANGMEISLPAGALYDDLYFKYSVSALKTGSYSKLHEVHYPSVPVHQYYRIAIEAINLPNNLRGKATIAQRTGTNKFTSIGGSWEGNNLVARTRNFGAFCIMVDSIKPTISPLNFSSATELKFLNTLKFSVKDDFTGIQRFYGEIDGKWILLEYDPKNNLLEYKFDSARIQSGIEHKMVIRVTDQMGNQTSYNILFFR